MLNKFEVILAMDEKKKDKPIWFPFMSHHEWHGFNDYRELVDFLEDGILPSESGYIQEDDMLLLPKPKSRRRRKKIPADAKAKEINEANSNGSATKSKESDTITKPIMRVRGGVITEITIPVKEVEIVEPVVIEQSVKIGPVIDGETVEAITEDIAYGGNGG
ncbi:hypothetical protein LCGC14_0856960 [marine sediment metagenome]|uniref:Uncharacterized protein n=1 Tax=marine sediment metagenome TaxID=412755 RepID=A0A0F9P8H9_9ZZZZ